MKRLAPWIAIAVVAACAPRPRPVTVEPLGNVIAQSEMTVGLNAAVRVLPDGRVFVSDEYGTQLWLLDPDLKNARLVGDTSAATGHFVVHGSYIRPYLGDSSWLIRSGISDGFVLDGQGRKVRSISLTNGQWGQGPWTIDMVRAPFTTKGDLMVLDAKPRQATAAIETVYVVRTSFAAPRSRDTVGLMTRDVPGASGEILAGDAAAMFSDGTIAIVRAKDYSIDWIARDGTRRNQKLPHQWTIHGVDTLPPFSWIGTVTVDADDQLWIEKLVEQTNPFRLPRGTFDIVDAEGRVVRRVALPPPSAIKAFTPGRVYYVLREAGRDRLVVASTR